MRRKQAQVKRQREQDRRDVVGWVQAEHAEYTQWLKERERKEAGPSPEAAKLLAKKPKL